MDNVPIQFSGAPGHIVQLSNPGGPVNLQWGPIQPVSQLGSQQLTSGKLAKNPDGSVTIWIAPTAAPRGTRHQLDPHTIDGVLRRPLPRDPGADRDPANHPHLLPSTGKQHAGVDPAPAEWVDGRHVRVPAPPAGGLASAPTGSGPPAPTDTGRAQDDG